MKTLLHANGKIKLACSSTAIVQVDGRLDVEAGQNSQIFFSGDTEDLALIAHENAAITHNQ